MKNGMVAMGNIGHKGVVMASGMMVAMGMLGIRWWCGKWDGGHGKYWP